LRFSSITLAFSRICRTHQVTRDARCYFFCFSIFRIVSTVDILVLMAARWLHTPGQGAQFSRRL
jgi:hypothetical protein